MYFPLTRPRRMRSRQFSRDLTRQVVLTVKDLIYPVFICEGKGQRQAIVSMPGVERLSVDNLLRELDAVVAVGIPAIALFPSIAQRIKSNDGKAAYDPDGLVQQAISSIKRQFPQLGIISDVALDPYTAHGQDGILGDDGSILNDETVKVLVKQALSHAHAGADIVAPSDMMDGRIGKIRRQLEQQGFVNTGILSYCAKYCSAFYGPFRDAVASRKTLAGVDKSSYQMDMGGAVRDVLCEARLDEQEGADVLLVKPGLPCLDVVFHLSHNSLLPVWAYQVSGEYSMLKFAVKHGCFEEKTAVLESVTALKRAGCSAVFTYYAKQVADWLRADA